MKIKPFNATWWGMLALQVAIITIISIIAYPLERSQVLTLLKLFNVGVGVYLFFYKFALSRLKDYDFNIWDDLPFYLCNLGTITAIIASFTDNRYLMGFVYAVSIFGAFIAYVFPDEAFCNIKMFSVKAIGFFGYHGLIICEGFLFVTTGAYVPKYSDILPIVIYLVVLLFFVHIVNTIIRKTKFPECNYSFTYGSRGNPILQKIYDKIPINLIYLYCILPVFAAYITIIFFITKLFV